MAVWVKHGNEVVRVRSWSLLRVAVAASLAGAILIPVIYDLMSDQGRDVTKRVLFAGCVLLVGAALAPWTSLTIDGKARRIVWHRVSVWGRRTIAAGLDDVSGVTLVIRPDLWLVCRCDLTVDTKLGVWSVPLAWSWRGTFHRPTNEALRAVRKALGYRGVESGKLRDLTERPKFQISLRRLLLATALSAVVLGLGGSFAWTSNVAIPGTLLAATAVVVLGLLYSPGSAVTERFLLSFMAMYGPLLWIVAENRPWGRTSGLYEEAILFPSFWIAVLPFGRHFPSDRPWVNGIVILCELAVSLGFAYRGWKSSLSWTALLGLVSVGSSYMLNLLWRE